MASDRNNLAQFKYSAMSNLVLQADRRFVTRRGDENTGDPESLAGRLSIREMGTLMGREKVKLPRKSGLGPQGVQRGDIYTGEDVLEREQRKQKRGTAGVDARGTGILSQRDLIVEDLKYRPRTTATRETYNLIITAVGKYLGDVPDHVTRSASDAVLEYLKDPNLKDAERKREIDDILGVSLGSKEFNEIVNLGKKITDYDATDEADPSADMADLDGELDERQGVAVVFDDEDENDDQPVFEVRDEDDSSEDENQVFADGDEADGEDQNQGTESAEAQPIDEFGETIAADPTSGSENREKASREVPMHEIDAYWLQRQVGQVYDDAHEQQIKTAQVLDILTGLEPDGTEKDTREIENDLMDLFEYDHHELVAKLFTNRERIVWATKWRQASGHPEQLAAIEREMVAAGQGRLVAEIRSRETGLSTTGRKGIKVELMDVDVPGADAVSEPKAPPQLVGGLPPQRTVHLESLIFEQGGHLMTNAKVKLPVGSTKRAFKGYEEIHVPMAKPRADDEARPEMPTSEMPSWARAGFGSATRLNPIQTRCYKSAFETDENILVCAPTGSGKTNVAMLAILRELGKHRDPETGFYRLNEFKMVLIAPLKALVQEQVANFGGRLASYGVKVAELTGDRQLTKAQIAETHLIVTTPEKWDVITRKASDTSYTNLVSLICIDEIHLLHDERGPVLESIVSRTIRRSEQTNRPTRLLGLSATLPNYGDVAAFLRVNPSSGLFFFDGSYRPCPLKQEFIGVTEKKPIRQIKTMNEICYRKALEHVGTNGNQMLIFVHSRKETGRTAKFIRDRAVEEETIGQLLRADAARREILQAEAGQVSNADLRDVLPYGFGIHHAGMSRADRTSVEELFAEGAIQVLVCTATLAWGVNLPAHTVIIKGTQIYSPERGAWTELSPQDVLQMLGRAGRPQFDSYGEGIIITTQSEIQYYLSLLNQQLPIESQLMSKLADNLNAEIVLGNVRDRDDAVEWLSYTYLFVRMLRTPALYGIGPEYSDDELLEQRRVDLVHSAALELARCGLVKYDQNTGKLLPTDLGRIASHYYVSPGSMYTYSQQLAPWSTTIELFRIFAMSDEFKYIPVRAEEKIEIGKLLGRVPIPVKESVEEPSAKINVLLQAFISRLGLDGLALVADMVYVTQSAGRILRALFEISLSRGWASVAKVALELCKMAERRMWPTMSPLRQFPNVPNDVITRAERTGVAWGAYFDLDAPRMGELLGLPRAGRLVVGLVERFPRISVSAHVQPVTRSALHVQLSLKSQFQWDESLHGSSEQWWILVEDCDGESILHHEQFVLRHRSRGDEDEEHLVDFTVAVSDPLPPHFFVTLVSDRWMHAETKLVVSLQHLVLPRKPNPPTPLLDLQPLPPAALKVEEYARLYSAWPRFNRIQTQTFNSLYNTDDNVLVCAASGSGKTICAEFALLRLWKQHPGKKAAYIISGQGAVDIRLADWNARLGPICHDKKISKLSGDAVSDLRTLESSDLVLSTPSQWDALSRQWRRRKPVQQLGLLIADELHLVGGYGGHVYESVLSRTRAMTLQLGAGPRIVGLAIPMYPARDVGEWLGASKHTIFNFGPRVRPVPLELRLQTFSIPHFPSRMLSMARPAYNAIVQLAPDKPALLFVPDRRQCRTIASELMLCCDIEDSPEQFLHTEREQLGPLLERISDPVLAASLPYGIGFVHQGQATFDRRAVEQLFQTGAIQVLLATRGVARNLRSRAALVGILGTDYFDGHEGRYVDYSIADVLHMLGRAGRAGTDSSAKAVLFTTPSGRDLFKRFLDEPLPVESSVADRLSDVLVAEISARTVRSTQDAVDWTTYLLFYRRLVGNPSYYGLSDTSHDGLSAFLSELVETSISELTEAGLVSLEAADEEDEVDDAIVPLNPAMIAAYYNVSVVSMQTLLLSLKGSTKLRGLFQIATSAVEFEDVPLRTHEKPLLKSLHDRLPLKLSDQDVESTGHSAAFKAFVLLQAHFARLDLPVDLAADQEVVLSHILNILGACVDVLASAGHLTAMRPMEACRMVVQAMWDRDSTLKQLPYFDDRRIELAASSGVTDILSFIDIMDPDSKDREAFVKKLKLNPSELSQIAEFTNTSYPAVDIEVESPGAVTTGDPSTLQVVLQRQLDEDEETPDGIVHAPFYPGQKKENWWLVVGDEASQSLYGIKRVMLARQLRTSVEFVVPKARNGAAGADGPVRRELSVWLVSDSYFGVDQAQTFTVEVEEGESSEEEGDEDDDEDEEMKD